MKKYIFWILSAATLLSCEDLAEINENPNATENPQPAYLLSATQYKSARMYWGEGGNSANSTYFDSSLLWVQYWARVQYTSPDIYNVQNTDFVGLWNVSYATLITNLNAIIQSDLSNNSYKAVATIWRSWVFLQLTNWYGDIPYSEFGKITPKYDSQETVLTGLLAELKNAENLLDVNQSISGDLIYGNNLNKWLKFSKSLRLRIALQIADRKEDEAKQIISELYTQRAELIASNDDNAKFAFTSSPQWNPWAEVFSTRDDQRISKTIVDKLLSLNDPRLPIFAQKTKDTTVADYVGAANGLSEGDASNQGFDRTSKIGTFFLEDESPAVFFTYAEVLFIFSEAAARGWISDDAKSFYDQAITASLQQFGITDITQISDYLAQSSVQFNASTWYENIGEQKWIAFFGQANDAFTDWRRLGYPKLVAGPASVLPAGQLPRRLFYPNTEQALNGTNYQNAVQNQGADNLLTRLWFDVENKGR